MNEAAGKQRKFTNDDTSSGSAIRLIGVRDIISSTNFWSLNNYPKRRKNLDQTHWHNVNKRNTNNTFFKDNTLF